MLWNAKVYKNNLEGNLRVANDKAKGKALILFLFLFFRACLMPVMSQMMNKMYKKPETWQVPNRTSIIFSVPFKKKTQNSVCLKFQFFFTVIVQSVWIKPWFTWLLISNFPLFNYSSHQAYFFFKFAACPVKFWKYHSVLPHCLPC